MYLPRATHLHNESFRWEFAISCQILTVGISLLRVPKSLTPNVTTSADVACDDRVGRNLTDEAQRFRRIAFANPDFGALVMLGIWRMRLYFRNRRYYSPRDYPGNR